MLFGEWTNFFRRNISGRQLAVCYLLFWFSGLCDFLKNIGAIVIIFGRKNWIFSLYLELWKSRYETIQTLFQNQLTRFSFAINFLHKKNCLQHIFDYQHNFGYALCASLALPHRHNT